MATLSKPTNGVNTDYANRIGLLFDAFNNGNYQFPAVQVPSADANTLDDYEEGTWTPSLGGTATYTSRTGTYTKIGRKVTLIMEMTVNAIGTGSTGVITGAPFTAATTTAGTIGFFTGIASNLTWAACYIQTTSITITGLTAAAATTPTAVFFGSGTQVHLSVTHFV